MRILVTGGRGYIGTHLIDILKQDGQSVTDVDSNLYEGCEFEPFVKADTFIQQDLCARLEAHQLEGFDCVMHLAAICRMTRWESLTRRPLTRLTGMAQSPSQPWRRRPVCRASCLQSSCSIYGKGEKLDLTEQDPTNPVYGLCRVEDSKRKRASAAWQTTTSQSGFLRNSTAYGYSPMLRIDLVVNNLLACAMYRGDIRIMSDGTPWRPLIHCRDIARAFLAFFQGSCREKSRICHQCRRQRSRTTRLSRSATTCRS